MPRYVSTFPVQSSRERAWKVLTDFEHYGEWNPQIPSMTGEPTEGSTVKLRLALPARPAMNLSAVIGPVIPLQRLAWNGHVGARWLFAGERDFSIAEGEDGTLTVTHLENIRGLLAPVFGLLMGGPVKASQAAHNAAFQKRCEDGQP